MTENDRKKWDAKFLKRLGSSEPSEILRKYWTLAPGRQALDIACGNGRNSVFLAQKGFTVDAVDISTVATSRLSGRHPRLNVICADLDSWSIPPARYDLIVNTRFLDRRIFQAIQEGLKKGGILVFESFLSGVRDEYCLEQNELLRVFRHLRVVFYEEREAAHHPGKSDQIASMVAVKASPPLN